MANGKWDKSIEKLSNLYPNLSQRIGKIQFLLHLAGLQLLILMEEKMISKNRRIKYLSTFCIESALKAESCEAGLQLLDDGGADEGSSVEEHGRGLHCQPPGHP